MVRDDPDDDNDGPGARHTSPLDRLLRKRSPFLAFNDHAKKVTECVELLPQVFDLHAAGEFDAFGDKADAVGRIEHEADLVKANLSGHLPKFLFMPVDRGDFEWALREQDAILDIAEDIAEILAARHVAVADTLVDDFRTHLAHSVDAVRAYVEAVDLFVELMEGEATAEARDMLKAKIKEVHEREHQADVLGFKLMRRIFGGEAGSDAMAVLHAHKLNQLIDDLADSAEDSADVLRAMIAK